jgi:hypothetical protein
MSIQTYDISKAKNCLDAYSKGLKQRESILMMSGALYKIKEVQRKISGYSQELYNAGKCANGDQNACRKLQHCTGEDKAYWIRHLASQICFSLGRDLVGTLYALEADGLTKSEVNVLRVDVDRRIFTLLSIAESARLDARTNWNQLNKQLALEGGEIYDFVVEASSFVDAVVNEVEK